MFNSIDRASVARDHNCLASTRQQEARDVARVAFQLCCSFRAVGDMLLIGEEHEPLTGHEPLQLAEHRKAPDARIKHADGVGGAGG